MNNTLKKTLQRRKRRAHHVRKKIHGTQARPRLSVHKTNKHLQAQLINDDEGVTIGSVSTYSKSMRDTEHNKKSKNAAKQIGEMIAKIAKDNKIKEVIFDRGAFKYHGVLAELADAARNAGLKF